MTETGFFYNEITDFQKELIDLAQNGYPKETDKFLRQEGRNLTALQKRIAKQDVGTSKGKKGWKKGTSYMSGFKTSKLFGEKNNRKVSAYNKARRAHLVEYGHRMCDKKGKQIGKLMVHGKYVITKALNQFKHNFESDCQKFTDDLFSGKFK